MFPDAGFGAASTFLGMAEELIVFIPLLISISLSLGFDKLTAVGVLLLGVYGAGGFAIIGPFNTMIAQEVAEVELLSGDGSEDDRLRGRHRHSIHHVISYGRKEKKKLNGATATRYDKKEEVLKSTKKRSRRRSLICSRMS